MQFPPQQTFSNSGKTKPISTSADNNKSSSSLTISSTNSSPKDAVSIYGGVASESMTVSQTANLSSALDTTNSRWSSSLQTVLDQPSATLPQRLIIGGIAFCTAFIVGWDK